MHRAETGLVLVVPDQLELSDGDNDCRSIN
jgi:hypothetical protein